MESKTDDFPPGSLAKFTKKFYEEVVGSPQFLQRAFRQTITDAGLDVPSLSTSEITQNQAISVNANYEIGCDVKYLKRNAKGETPLHTAARKKDLESVRDMLRNNVNPNTQDNAGWTPLHEAVFDDNYKITLELLAAGAIVNVPGFDFTTPLHVATHHNNLPIVKLLLKFGADPTVRDISGKCPEFYAKNSEIISLLKEYSTDTKCIEMAKIFQKKAAPRPIVIFMRDEEMISCEVQSHLEEELNFRFTRKLDKEVTHVVVQHCKNNVCETSYDIMKAILLGCYLVNSNWLHACNTNNEIVSFDEYELNGTEDHPTSNGPRKARNNFLNLSPLLFTGCQIYAKKVVNMFTIRDLIISSGAKYLNREPNPEHSPSTYFLHHCPSGHTMENTSTLILYDKSSEPKIKYNMKHMKTLPVSWFLDCIQTFEIREPH